MNAEQLIEKINTLAYEAQSANVTVNGKRITNVRYDEEHDEVILEGVSDEENE